jgi:hypothetical protein
MGLVRMNVSKERDAFIFKVGRIRELETTLAETSRQLVETFLRNVASDKSNTASHPRIRYTSQSLPWKPQIRHLIGEIQRRENRYSDSREQPGIDNSGRIL